MRGSGRQRSLSPRQTPGEHPRARSAADASLRWKVPLAWAALAMLWGSTWVVIKIGLHDLPPYGFAAARFLIAALALLPFVIGRADLRRISGSDARLVAFTGILTFSLSYGLVFWAAQYMPAAAAALLFATCPLFGLFIAPAYLTTDRLQRKALLGTLLALAGAGLLLLHESRAVGDIATPATLAVLAAAALYAWADVLIKKKGSHIDPRTLTCYQMTVGALPLLALTLTVEADPLSYEWTPAGIAGVLYLGVVGSAGGFALYRWLMQRIAVTKALELVLATPIAAFALEVVFLHTRPTGSQLLGSALALGGLLLALRPSTLTG